MRAPFPVARTLEGFLAFRKCFEKFLHLLTFLWIPDGISERRQLTIAERFASHDFAQTGNEVAQVWAILDVGAWMTEPSNIVDAARGIETKVT